LLPTERISEAVLPDDPQRVPLAESGYFERLSREESSAMLDDSASEPVAQLVEHRTFNPWVAGSIPAGLNSAMTKVYGRRREAIETQWQRSLAEK
jgi:hypothetical protein